MAAGADLGLEGGAAFRIDAAAVAAGLPGVLFDEVLPGEIPVGMVGGKLDVEKGEGNQSELTLRCDGKTGKFSGAFKLYRVERGRLKVRSASVSGILLGGKGLGTATVKKPSAAWPVTIGL